MNGLTYYDGQAKATIDFMKPPFGWSMNHYRRWMKWNGIRFAATLMREDGYPVEVAVRVLCGRA